MCGGPATADAHDACRVGQCGENRGQLMLMMLAGFGHVRTKQGQLMLMMLAGFGLWGKTRAADAHNAGRVWKYVGKNRCS